jgi:hypothetical protein
MLRLRETIDFSNYERYYQVYEKLSDSSKLLISTIDLKRMPIVNYNSIFVILGSTSFNTNNMIVNFKIDDNGKSSLVIDYIEVYYISPSIQNKYRIRIVIADKKVTRLMYEQL